MAICVNTCSREAVAIRNGLANSLGLDHLTIADVKNITIRVLVALAQLHDDEVVVDNTGNDVAT